MSTNTFTSAHWSEQFFEGDDDDTNYCKRRNRKTSTVYHRLIYGNTIDRAKRAILSVHAIKAKTMGTKYSL